MGSRLELARLRGMMLTMIMSAVLGLIAAVTADAMEG
jgi:hypothetical protein